MNTIRPLVVIGAGPAGLMAGLTAAEKGIKVLLLERGNHLGGKIPVTGDGKGNLSNIDLDLSHYNSASPGFPLAALREFGFKKTREFFEKIGIKLYTDQGGRVYPYSQEAASIQKLLVAEVHRLNIEVITGIDIQKIGKIGSTFEILMKHLPSCYAHRLILATGGLAAPQLGATGDGYRWAVQLGHHLEPPFPALVQLTSFLPHLGLLDKLKLAKVEITLFIDDKLKANASGDLLFIPCGISGTAIFSISRLVSLALAQGQQTVIMINFTPGLNYQELFQSFNEQKNYYPQKSLLLFLQGFLPERLSQFILKTLRIDFDLTIGLVSEGKINNILKNITNFYLPINGTQSWKYAQVTCGGISVKEVNPETMESRIVPHLYFAGEILDVDGDCGGYNLQWAWSSGYLAGKAASQNI
ncbi:MAG TPA: NAD(P)/FAD-dependent oxidoreductase [Atribacterota bacterium]|nr:NAD(P)/FAD-dependent oxidoreductase [Atribacterota bacterium]